MCRCVKNPPTIIFTTIFEDFLGLTFIFPSFKTSHTTLFWFLEDTQGARFYDMHGTTLHLFVIYIVSRAIHEETFRVETRVFDKN